MKIVFFFVDFIFIWNAVCLELFVYEEQPIGTIVGTPVSDGYDFRFTTEQTDFYINNNTSEISTLIQLDRDSLSNDNISLQIRWSLFSPTPSLAYTTLSVVILDLNDNPPSFPTSGVTVIFSELSAVETNMELSRASDIDRGVNGTISYSLTTGPSEELQMSNIPFELNVTKLPMVYIQVSNKLDYETKHIYQLLLEARDGGSPSLRSHIMVVVQVMDENDQVPAFLSGNYSYRIPEGQAVGEMLGRVETIDTDTGMGGSVVYTLVGDNIPFSVAMDGVIRVSEDIDYEENEYFEFRVTATNPAPLQPSTATNFSSVTVSVQVTDVNDNSPSIRFRQGQYRLRLSLEEELVCPSADPVSCGLIAGLRGTANERCLIEVGIVEDEDSGLAGEVTGVVIEAAGREYFTPMICNSLKLMSRKAVFVYNIAAADRENQTLLSFGMSLQDGGNPALQSDWLLEVQLTDVNDNVPSFSEESYGVSLAENITQGTVILTVSAVDEDQGENGTVRYSILGVTPSQAAAFLSVDSVTGEMRTVGVLDREQLGSRIEVAVQAADQGTVPLSNTSLVVLTLTDINDNYPIFPQLSYVSHVREDVSVMSVVTEVTATDADSGFAGDVRYSLAGSDVFGIVSESGRVLLLSPLDYESTQEYNLTLTATDRAVPPLRSSVILNITVTDYNDNSPVFVVASLIASVPEDTTVGTVVHRLRATDRDSGVNGAVSFLSLDQSVPFLLSETGEVTTDRTLDRENTSIYTFSVVARDNALTNQLSVSATLRIVLSDVDDSPPTFQYTHIVTTFLTDQATPLLIGPSVVIDRDTTPIQCSIPINQNRFQLLSGGNLCHLYTTMPLADTFTLRLRAQDTDNIIQSDVRIVMTSLTNDTINNSLVIELSDLSQLEFLSSFYTQLMTAVSSHITLHIWSFIPSPTNQSDLRVLLSARYAESGALLSADSVFQALTLNVTINRISPCADDNRCVKGVCVDRVVVYGDTYSHVVTTSHLYNNLIFSTNQICSCEDGYTGERCQRRINPCLDYAPCLNQGFCAYYPVQREYVCYCQVAFTGRHCETPVSPCSSNPCATGTCVVQSANSFTCMCPPGYTGGVCDVYIGFCPTNGINPCMNDGRCRNGDTGFNCVCPDGFVGEICQTSTLCFSHTSYIQYGTNNSSSLSDIEVSFQMKTTQQAGQLVYLQEGDTFLILELINASIHYLSRSPLSDFVEIYPTQNVSDGRWHSVTLKSFIHEGFASLTVDEKSYSGAQTDSLDHLGLLRQSTLATEIVLPPVSVPLTIGGLANHFTDFSTHPAANLNLDLSGTETYSGFLEDDSSILDYTGAIRNLSLNGVLLSLPGSSSRQVAGSVSQTGECERDTNCSVSSSCSGRGSCLQQDTDHTCQCEEGYTGEDCQIETKPVTLRGKGAISYQLSNLTLESHLRSLADWSIESRTLIREREYGIRSQVYTHSLYPRQYLGVSFRTRTDDGVILTTRDTENYAILQVSAGHVRFTLRNHVSANAYFNTTLPETVTNASLFTINVTLTREGLWLFIESEEGNATHWVASANQIPWLEANAPVQLLLGGLLDGGDSQNFTGCVSGLGVAGIQLPLHRPINGELGVTSQLIGEVLEGCDEFGTCTMASCSEETTCIPVWTGIRCDCPLGERYDKQTQQCDEIDECAETTTPCHNGGSCIDGTNSYVCVCGLLHTGRECREVNAVTVMVIMVVVVMCLSVLLLPLSLWPLYRYLANSSRRSKQTHYFDNNNYTTQTNIPINTLKPLRHLSHPDKNRSMTPPLQNMTPPLRNMSPPLANYPPAYQMKEKAQTFPTSHIPPRNHSNTMPVRPYSPPLANPLEPQHSIPGKRLIRAFNIYDQYV